MELLQHIPTLDAILSDHAAALGRDFTAYRNHAFRVANLCAAQTGDAPELIEKIAIAAAFHDLGIWTDGTFDYLSPSVRLARSYLSSAGRAEWIPEISAAIFAHHKVTKSDEGALVESFRRADWMDVTIGAISSGTSRRLFQAAVSTWPRAGFHKRLAQLGWQRAKTHPWNPLPMVRL